MKVNPDPLVRRIHGDPESIFYYDAETADLIGMDWAMVNLMYSKKFQYGEPYYSVRSKAGVKGRAVTAGGLPYGRQEFIPGVKCKCLCSLIHIFAYLPEFQEGEWMSSPYSGIVSPARFVLLVVCLSVAVCGVTAAAQQPLQLPPNIQLQQVEGAHMQLPNNPLVPGPRVMNACQDGCSNEETNCINACLCDAPCSDYKQELERQCNSQCALKAYVCFKACPCEYC